MATSMLPRLTGFRKKQRKVWGLIGISLMLLLTVLISTITKHRVVEESEEFGKKNANYKGVQIETVDKQQDIDNGLLKDGVIEQFTFPPFNGIPLFDPNEKYDKKMKNDKNMQKMDDRNRELVAHNPKPQPKKFPVDLICTPTANCLAEESLLIFIFSQPQNRGHRTAIRRTWGRFDASKYSSVEIKWFSVFVVGRGHADWLNKIIIEENEKYNDVLQGDFVDSPYEDTRKFMLATKWLKGAQLNGCKLRFVIKSVDNIFHNLISISGWLKAKFVKSDESLYIGKLIRKDVPIRDPKNPLFVPPADYAEKFFPDLIQGPVYAFSYDALISMSRAMSFVTPIAMEDAYIGLLAKHSGIIPRHNDHFHMIHRSYDICHYLRMFFIFNVLPNDHIVIYKDIHNPQRKNKCVPHNNHIET